MTKKGGASFAGEKANMGVPELGRATSNGAPEDPAVIGGSSSVSIPEGTLVELGEKRGYKVVEEIPKE